MKEGIQRYFEKAAECIEDAGILLEARRFSAALNRAYYAMLNAATAVLLERDIKRRSHHGTISAFGQFLVKPGHVPQDLHKFFRDTFELRQQSDYGLEHEVTADEANDATNRATDFVDTCRKLCN